MNRIRTCGRYWHINVQSPRRGFPGHYSAWRLFHKRKQLALYMTDELTCSECRQPFESVSESGIVLDYCSGCQLTWFDKNELELYCERNGISLAPHRPSELQSDSDCPKCETPLNEIRERSTTFCACHNCGGFLVSSLLLDRKLPEKERTRPLQQFDGVINVLDLLQLLASW